MSSLSEDFKRKLLEPIEELFKEAQAGLQPPTDSGGRNWQIPDPLGFYSDSVRKAASRKQRSKKAEQGKVDEATLREAMAELNALIGLSFSSASKRYNRNRMSMLRRPLCANSNLISLNYEIS